MEVLVTRDDRPGIGDVAAVNAPRLERSILILGMHRSGTSCLAALLQAAGAGIPGPTLRNWDNPRGHHEALALLRLNEEVLATSGGHWLRPPRAVRWSVAQAETRDRLLGPASEGRPSLWKDPRSLLVLPFWQASAVPFHPIGIVRHPLAVARSLRAWRGTPIEEGLRLWAAHNEALVASGAPVLDFDMGSGMFVASVADFATAIGLEPDREAMRAAFVTELVHHDARPSTEGGGDARPAPSPLPGERRGGVDDAPGAAERSALLDRCLALHAQLRGRAPPSPPGPRSRPGANAFTVTRSFPWNELDSCRAALAAGERERALTHARRALQAASDVHAVLAPVAALLLAARAEAALLALCDDLPRSALTDLWRGKALLRAGRAAEAVEALAVAAAPPASLYEARQLLPVALWETGAHAAADAALEALLPEALYPFRLHFRRAEWAWTLGDAARALDHLERALATAPDWRKGRLLHRRAGWRAELGDAAGAAADRARAGEVDPGYRRCAQGAPSSPSSG